MRLCIAGDWHGTTKYARKAILHAAKNNAEKIVQLGDFGFWESNNGYLKVLSETSEKVNVPIYFVDGNHENHPELNKLPINDDGFRKVAENIYHIPRGHTWIWGSTKLMGLGGAYSIDSQYRILGFDWFEEEVISEEDAKTASSKTADIMFTHDSPMGAVPPTSRKNFGWPQDAIIKSERNRVVLRRVVDEVKPKQLWHGHFHVKYETSIELYNGDKVDVRGLDCDGTMFHQNMDFIEV